MPAIDSAKEKIAYLKLWLGIIIVTLISLISWLVANYNTVERLLIVLNIITIGAVFISIFLLNKSIRKTIRELKDM
jgi:hypothetical protein